MEYYEYDGTLKKELFNTISEDTAKKFVIRENGRINEKKSITSNQLRKFYNEFKSYEKKFEFMKNSDQDSSHDEIFKKILPLVKMVNAKLAYADKKVPKEFKCWLKDNINSINNYKDFKAFLLHFESVVGFCYGLGIKD